MNFAENMLLVGKGRDDDTAILEMNETNQTSPAKVTWAKLREMTQSYADALLSSGIQDGDVVVGE